MQANLMKEWFPLLSTKYHSIIKGTKGRKDRLSENPMGKDAGEIKRVKEIWVYGER